MKHLSVFVTVCLVILLGLGSPVAGEEVITVLTSARSVARATMVAADLFNERYKGQYRVEVDGSLRGTALLSRINLQFISGNVSYDILPDLNSWAAGLNRYFHPLDEMIKESDVDLSAYLPVLGKFTHEGKVRGLPFRMGVEIFVYRKDLFEEAGLPPIVGDETHWNDVKEAARKLTRDTDGDGKPDIYGMFQMMSDATRGVETIDTYYGAPGATWLTSDEKEANPLLKSDYAAERFEFMRSFWKEGLTPDPLAQGPNELWEIFQLGKAAMGDTVFSAYASYFEQPGTSSKGKMGYSAVPIHPRGPMEPNAFAGVWVFGIDKNSKKKKGAFEFLKFATSFEAQKAMATQQGNGPTRWDVFDDPEYYGTNPVVWAVREALQRNFQDEIPGGARSYEFGTLIVEALHEFMLSEASGRSFGEKLYDSINRKLKEE